MEGAFKSIDVNVVNKNIQTKSELSFKIYSALGSVKKLILENQIDVIHAQTRVTQVMAYWLKKSTGCAFVTTGHGFFKPRLFRKIFPCWGDSVIAISPAVYQHLNHDLKVNSDRIALIENGIDLTRFQEIDQKAKEDLRRRFGLKDEAAIGIIARLSDVKGIDILIKAMPKVISQMPKVRVLIMGQGKEEEALKKLTSSLKADGYVQFHPIVDNTAAALPVFDIFVMPSRQEGLGLSVMEAQACGLPVIASKVGGLPTLIKHELTGLLVEPENPDALAQAILRLLKDKALAQKLGTNGRDFIRKNYSAEGMVEKTMNLYTRLLV
jgi:glycosyltransferase involved in cell wall biosynthesis